MIENNLKGKIWNLKREHREGKVFGDGLGIRTPGTFRFDGFQDRCFRPLSQSTSKLTRRIISIKSLFASKTSKYR